MIPALLPNWALTNPGAFVPVAGDTLLGSHQLLQGQQQLLVALVADAAAVASVSGWKMFTTLVTPAAR